MEAFQETKNYFFLKRVTIRNYKSISAAKVDLEALTFLVGSNGSGKSNFLDAIRFVSDSLRTSLDHALRDRGTIKEVRRRSGGHPNHFAIRLDFELPDGRLSHYSFRVGAKPDGAYEVQNEECAIYKSEALGEPDFYKVRSGKLIDSSVKPMPAGLRDRLFLVAASGIPDFRPIYDALSKIEVYNLNPKEISSPQKPDPGEILRRDESNSASVFRQLNTDTQNIIEENLARIVPGIASVEAKALGSQETLEFRQTVKSQEHPWRFLAPAMSDGTLRAFGVLLAVFQGMNTRQNQIKPLLIGIEEPEIAFHPAALFVLLSALREGSRYCQIIITSHSPDLLDNDEIHESSILAVESVSGIIKIGPLDNAGRKMLREKLFTPGELLRQNQLKPDRTVIADVKTDKQLKLFEMDEGA